jgi:microcystin-dependent protein
MADPFVAEIRVVGFNFAPKGWALCDGQLLPISQNTALFSLLGTFYGGDGKSTFALPNIQGRAVLGQGQGPGLSDYFLGQEGGEETVTLLQSEIPAHSHGMFGSIDDAQFQAPQPDRELATSSPGFAYQTNNTTNTSPMSPQELTIAGGSLPHNNISPMLVLNYVIAMQGVFPPRG